MAFQLQWWHASLFCISVAVGLFWPKRQRDVWKATMDVGIGFAMLAIALAIWLGHIL